MLIQLDSNFRDYVQYPYSSDYIITINGTPPVDLHKKDVRSSYLSADYIRYAYRWIGNSSFNNPLSKVKNDSLKVEFIPRSSNEFLLIPNFSELSLTNDYFVGLQFWNEENKLSANVIQYNFSTLSVTLDSNIFDNYSSSTTLNDIQTSKSKNFDRKIGYFVNPSTHAGNNLLLMGTTRFSSNISTKLVLVKGLNTDLFVTNVTKNWTTNIVSIEGEFRNVILKDIPSYDSNDFFIVTTNQTNMNQIISNQKPFLNGIRNFEIAYNSIGVKVGDILISEKYPVEFRVSLVNRDGKVSLLDMINPGENVSLGPLTLSVKNNTSLHVTILVQSCGSGLLFNKNIYLKNTVMIEDKMVVGIVDEKNNDIVYFVILEKIDETSFDILYLELDQSNYSTLLNIYKNKNLITAYLISYYTIFPNVVIPFHSYQNTVCCLIRLVSLSLPNLPVCGFNIRLADFPYLLIAFSNSQGTLFEVQSQIFSNVPASTNCNFICPISNVKNPDLNFVSVTTKQVALFKFKPKDSLRFQILLPNGEILKYSRSGVNFSLLQNREKLYSRRTEFCIPLNVPLTENTLSSTKIVYPYILNNNINAVFDFQIIQ